MTYFVHPQGICESESIGERTRIWAFAHILPGARIGAECNICDGVFIENNVVIGDRVTIKCGVQIWNGIEIENDVFIGPNATFTNDLFPRSKHYPEQFEKTILREGASIGANATILPGIEIGRNAMVGAGSVVTKSVPANAIVFGNPARISGYANHRGQEKVAVWQQHAAETVRGIEQSCVEGVTIHTLPVFTDIRGDLTVGEFAKDIPFTPKRYFLVFHVPSQETRGEHAHKCCHQFLICVKGSCSVVADNGKQRQEFLLNQPGIGLYLPPMIWGTEYKYSHDAVLLVFASDEYDPNDYIRDYNQYLSLLETP